MWPGGGVASMWATMIQSAVVARMPAAIWLPRPVSEVMREVAGVFVGSFVRDLEPPSTKVSGVLLLWFLRNFPSSGPGFRMGTTVAREEVVVVGKVLRLRRRGRMKRFCAIPARAGGSQMVVAIAWP